MPAMSVLHGVPTMVTTLTPHEVRHHFRAAQCDGIPLIPQCDACDARGGALFAAAYRHWRIERGFPDPGNLCALCAARNEQLIDFDVWCRLASEASPRVANDGFPIVHTAPRRETDIYGILLL